MLGLLSILYLVLFAVTLISGLPVGWLLVGSAFIVIECVLVVIDRTEKLTDLGKIIFSASIIGLIYSICILQGYNIPNIF
jgi:hypothetical protein